MTPSRTTLAARLPRAAVAAGAALLAPAVGAPVAHAVTPVVSIQSKAWLTPIAEPHGKVAMRTRFHVGVTFSTDVPGAPLQTVQRSVLHLPDHAGTNGSRFASCSARQIEALHGDVSRCPEGSRIGGGSLTAEMVPTDITAKARIAMFNSHHGKAITFNFQTTTPAVVNESVDAPLTLGKAGETLELVVPESLQQVAPGLFVGLKTFDVTVGGETVAGGRRYPYLRARTCPTEPMRGDFAFKDFTTGASTSTSAQTRVVCGIR